jgi:drug/metabolite transporter (DMT)-like permease
MATETKPTGIRNPWLHLAVSVTCVAIYELLLKRGAAETANPNSSWSWTGISGLGSIYVWIAIVFVIVSLITWLNVPLGSWLILGENIITLRWIGIAFVSLGLAVVAKPVARLEEEL